MIKKNRSRKIKIWCEENAALSKEDRNINTLKTTNDWIEFQKAIATARQAGYQSLLPAIIGRYYDFRSFYWPVHKDLIAETVYELGNEQYIETIRKWSRDTTGIKDTTYLDVKFWTSLYLLKHDRDSYEYAMNLLESVLRKCDGTFYYPKAMDLLLSMKNDKRAFKLAEGILNKAGFQSSIYWEYNLNFVKKLLSLKSDYTFNFISKKLASFTPEETESFNTNNANVNRTLQNENYVRAVDQLKSNKPGYDPGSNFKTRLEYKKALSKWFVTQYKLLKKGKPNELLLIVTQVNEPVRFVDAPR